MAQRTIGHFLQHFEPVVHTFVQTQINSLRDLKTLQGEKVTALNALVRALVATTARLWVKGKGSNDELLKMMGQELRMARGATGAQIKPKNTGMEN